MPLLPILASARRRRRRAARPKVPRGRAGVRPAGSPPCRGRVPASPRARRPGPRGSGSGRARTRRVRASLSNSPACGRARAWRRASPGRGRRGRSGRSSALPAVLDLGGPLVYLHLREDTLLDEQPLGGRSPAFVVREVAVVGEGLYGAAVLVGGLDALLAQRRVDGVRYALPVLRFADPRVHGAGSPPPARGPGAVRPARH